MADLRTHGGDDADRSQDSGGRRLYNPYNDLQIPYRTLYDIPTSPEFLFQEESLAQRRSWGENLAYYTGIGYLAGGASGAFLAVRRALRSAEPGDTLKIRDTDDWINSVVAGLGTGALFRAANGPRSAVVAGAIGGLMVGAAVAGKQILKRYVPI